MLPTPSSSETRASQGKPDRAAASNIGKNLKRSAIRASRVDASHSCFLRASPPTASPSPRNFAPNLPQAWAWARFLAWGWFRALA
jgi:hypothetical protein